MGRIYIRNELPMDPRVLRIARALEIPPLHVLGCLSALWIYADQHSHDGILSHVTPATIDDMVGVVRFAELLIVVGWLVVGEDEVTIPRFSEHCGIDQKRRKVERLRKRRQRAVSHGTRPGQTRDKAGTDAGRPAEVAPSSALASALKEKERVSPPKKTAAIRAVETWLSPFGGEWGKRFGELPYGRAGKVLKPLVAELGADEALRRFAVYCASQTGDLAKVTVERFKAVYKTYAPSEPDAPRDVTGSKAPWYFECRDCHHMHSLPYGEPARCTGESLGDLAS